MQINKVAADKKPFEPKKVDIRECVVEDLINAERITGKSTGFEFLAAVAASCSTFDDQQVPTEDVRRMRSKDFLDITDALGLNGQEISPDSSSTSSGKEGSGSQLSSVCPSPSLDTGSEESTDTSVS